MSGILGVADGATETISVNGRPVHSREELEDELLGAVGTAFGRLRTATGERAGTNDRADGGTRRLITGGNPDAPAAIFAAGAFEDAGEEFLPDPRIDRIADALIVRHDLPAADARVLYRWKDKGGDANGRAVLVKCVKLSGHGRHFAKADYLIWLAADACRDARIDNWQLEALIYHELLHIEVEEDAKGKVTRSVRGHDAELFVSEFAFYGAWMFDLRRVQEAVTQMPLFGEGAA